jgi:succinate dehydrogenase hydrophobic anchor subunit
LALTFFLFMHLGVAALGLIPARYDAAAMALRHLSEKLPILDAALLILIAAQTAVGIRLLIRSGLSYRSSRCKDDGRLRYFFQRWTAVLLLAFLALHLAMFKLLPGQPTFATVSHRFTFGGNPFLTAFYALVIVAIAFHAGNGLWTGASVWGKRDARPRLWLGIAGASGTIIALLGFIALRAFAS